MNPNKRILLKQVLIIAILFAGSCQKFVDIPAPKTSLVSTNVFTNDQSAIAAMTGIYVNMMSSYSSFLNEQLSLIGGLSADEFVDYSGIPDQIQVYQNALTPGNNYVLNLWQNTYNYIYQANAILEGLKSSTALAPTTKTELEGEAKFFRAICYFYLVNFFGNIPLAITTNYQTNNALAAASVTEIYQQIIRDCLDAQNLLPGDYSFSNGERVRPNKFAASALLARIYLFTKDWKDAEMESGLVISASDLYSLPADLNQVFLANSVEAILQLQPVQPGLNTVEGNTFILTGFPTSVALSDSLTLAFEPNDNRRTNWIDSVLVGGTAYYYPFKYKVQSGSTVTEYSMALRLAEQYLIRAESRAWQNNLTGAAEDLNMIRNRAGLPNTNVSDQENLLKAIAQERRTELFTENGSRWLDLIRSGKATEVLGALKTNWTANDTLYPIPLNELQKNTHLNQNAGY
jgi:hypothetical protein